MNKSQKKNFLAVIFLALFFFTLFEYFDYRFGTVSRELSEARRGVEALSQKLATVQDKEERLEKLSTLDPELLDKYSKIYFLNEHYVPASISTIPAAYTNPKGGHFQVHSSVLPYLEAMIDAGNQAGIYLQVVSGYRSFGDQATLKANYIVTYGLTKANQFSADQGYSEHQLGTTVDLTTRKLDGALDGFEKTPEYKWLEDNAYKYGFILSYPPGNTYYQFEPWHWRFVGVELATRLHAEKINFYEMDQRVIDTYLEKIFD